jgi:hypothetical protein
VEGARYQHAVDTARADYPLFPAVVSARHAARSVHNEVGVGSATAGVMRRAEVCTMTLPSAAVQAAAPGARLSDTEERQLVHGLEATGWLRDDQQGTLRMVQHTLRHAA